MSSIVGRHNTKLLQSNPEVQQPQGCNCQGGPDTCPLTPAECQKNNVIYVASVTSPDGVEHYTGLTGNTFKKRYNKHNADFRKNENKTRLSTHINRLKAEGKDYQLKWEILDRAPTHNPVSRKCRLCLKEIYYIIFRPDSASLNSRNELFNTCRHRKQQLLTNSWNMQIFSFWYPTIYLTTNPTQFFTFWRLWPSIHMKQICKGVWTISKWSVKYIFCIFSIVNKNPIKMIN